MNKLLDDENFIKLINIENISNFFDLIKLEEEILKNEKEYDPFFLKNILEKKILLLIEGKKNIQIWSHTYSLTTKAEELNSLNNKIIN